MTDEELKPCPFCGGPAEIIEGEECAYVQCLDMKMHRALWFDGDNAAADEVREQWNRRAADRLQALTGNARVGVTDDMVEVIARELKASGVPSRPMARRIASALEAALPSGGVRVKPLEWEKGVVDWAKPQPGMKYVACSTTPQGSWAWWLDDAPETRAVFPSEGEAKAAAQADYERRILSAIDPTQAQGEAETVHEAVKDAFSGIDGQVLLDIAQRREDDEYQNSPAWLWFGDEGTSFGRWNKGEQVAYIRGDIAAGTLDAAQSALTALRAERERLERENERLRNGFGAIRERIANRSYRSHLTVLGEIDEACADVLESTAPRAARQEEEGGNG